MSTVIGAAPPFSPAVQPDPKAETREGFAAYIRQEYNRRLIERRPFEQQWLLNMAFIEGNHYAIVHKITGELHTPEKKYPWEQREVFNNIAPVYETRIAKLIRNRSRLGVRPSSPDEDDIASAKIAQRLLEYNYDEQNMPDLLAQAVSWSEACGTVFLKNLWNPAKGKTISDPQGGLQIPLGDVETVVCSPFELFPENIFKSRVEDQRSIIHAKAWPLDSDHIQTLVELYKQLTGEDFTPAAEDVTAVTIGRGTTVLNGLPEFRFAAQNLKNHTAVIEYYERPSRKYPKGRFAILMGTTIMYYGPLPYQKDLDFPIVKIDSIRRPNCFWSKSVIERLIPLQRRYNAVRNRVSEYLNRVGLGQWSAEEGTTDVETLTNEPGLVIEYTRGARPPTPVAFPPLPGTFVDEAQALMSEFFQISGVHEVSQSQIPHGAGGSPSGVMISQLQEQDDTRLATSQRYIDQAIEKTGKQWLLRYKEFVTENRTFAVAGKNQTVQVLEFNANTIRSYNVVVEASAAMANSPSSRRDMVFAMLDRGLFNDPNTGKPSARGIKKVFEMLEFGNWESYEERRAIPENRAQWENHLMALGQQVSVWSWEDHEIHMEIHNVYRQTEEFYDLLQGPNGQGIAQQFEAHVQQHMGYLNAAAAPAGQPVPESAAPPPGGPPPAAMSPPTAEQLGPPPPTPAPAMTQPPSTFGQNPLNAILAQAHQLEQTQGPGAADQFMRAAVAQMQAGKG